MVSLNMTLFLEICAGIGVICAAGVWISKLLKPLIKPLEDIKKEVSNHSTSLDNDTKEIALLKEQSRLNTKTVHLLLEVNLAILEHLETGNATNKMSSAKEKVQKFLIEN